MLEPNGLAVNGVGDQSPGGYSMQAGVVTEIVMTAFFLLIIMGSTHSRAPAGFAPLAIGLGLTLIHLISIPVTNTSVNPARSTGSGADRRRPGLAAAVDVLGGADRRRRDRRRPLPLAVAGWPREPGHQGRTRPPLASAGRRLANCGEPLSASRRMAKIETPQPVRGTQSLLGEEADRFHEVVAAFDRVRRLFGFKRVEVPLIEPTAGVRPDDRRDDRRGLQGNVFVRGPLGRQITLRPEFTAGICRAYLSEGWQQYAPLKVATHGAAFRYERPQKGRYRQFHQLDAEIIGAAEPQADVELSLGVASC